MADEKDIKQPEQPAATGGLDMAANTTSRALSDAAKLAEEQSIDEGEEGGHYIVGGIHVDSEGRPLKKYNKG